MKYSTSTFSILGVDKKNNKIGVASASCVIGIGGRVQFFRPQIGIAITQHIDMSNIANKILEEICLGNDLASAIKISVESYPEKSLRQVAAIDFSGNIESFTGEECTAIRSSFRTDNFYFIGNTLSSDFSSLFKEKIISIDNNKSLSENLLYLLNVFNELGADKRGCESAALLVVPFEIQGWESQVVNLRIDYSQKPVFDLINLYKLWSKRFGFQ